MWLCVCCDVHVHWRNFVFFTFCVPCGCGCAAALEHAIPFIQPQLYCEWSSYAPRKWRYSYPFGTGGYQRRLLYAVNIYFESFVSRRNEAKIEWTAKTWTTFELRTEATHMRATHKFEPHFNSEAAPTCFGHMQKMIIVARAWLIEPTIMCTCSVHKLFAILLSLFAPMSSQSPIYREDGHELNGRAHAPAIMYENGRTSNKISEIEAYDEPIVT